MTQATSDKQTASSAYGGPGWQARQASHAEEIGAIWSDCGQSNEWARLTAVLLHEPGPELAMSEDPDAVQMLAPLDAEKAAAEHRAMASAYEAAGVAVHHVAPKGQARANQMFCADLFWMTPEGAILARPASTVRAGEEREVARALADMGVPILRTLTGTATFEGADAMWLDAESVLVGLGQRTNAEAAFQIGEAVAPMGAEVIAVDLPYGTMHLMGMLRIVDEDLALAWPRRTPYGAVEALRARGYEVAFLNEAAEAEASATKAFNFVTLGPRKILMVDGNPAAKAFYEGLGIECLASPALELSKAAGAVGCLTGIVGRAAA